MPPFKDNMKKCVSLLRCWHLFVAFTVSSCSYSIYHSFEMQTSKAYGSDFDYVSVCFKL